MQKLAKCWVTNNSNGWKAIKKFCIKYNIDTSHWKNGHLSKLYFEYEVNDVIKIVKESGHLAEALRKLKLGNIRSHNILQRYCDEHEIDCSHWKRPRGEKNYHWTGFGEISGAYFYDLKQGAKKRDHYTCQYCGNKFESDGLNLDHVIPDSRGGKRVWTNIVASCFECNGKKANRTPQEAKMRLLRDPKAPKGIPPAKKIKNIHRIQDWDHFLIN